jgi:hypothetical protein
VLELWVVSNEDFNNRVCSQVEHSVFIRSLVNCLSKVQTILLTELEIAVLKLRVWEHHKEIRSFTTVTLELPEKLVVNELSYRVLEILEIDKLINVWKAEPFWIEEVTYLSLTLASDIWGLRVAL